MLIDFIHWRAAMMGEFRIPGVKAEPKGILPAIFIW